MGHRYSDRVSVYFQIGEIVLTATAAQVGYYVDTTGIASGDIDNTITDATAIITGRLDGSSISSTLADALAAIQTAIFIANKDPRRVRTGQFDKEFGEQIADWTRTIETSLRYGRLYIDEAR